MGALQVGIRDLFRQADLTGKGSPAFHLCAAADARAGGIGGLFLQASHRGKGKADGEQVYKSKCLATEYRQRMGSYPQDVKPVPTLAAER